MLATTLGQYLTEVFELMVMQSLSPLFLGCGNFRFLPATFPNGERRLAFAPVAQEIPQSSDPSNHQFGKPVHVHDTAEETKQVFRVTSRFQMPHKILVAGHSPRQFRGERDLKWFAAFSAAPASTA
jgi:hypothetical protein